MDVSKLTASIQSLKEQLKNVMTVSADLIERNSQIDSGIRPENSMNPAPKFEFLLEEFISTCNSIELHLRTMQECLQQNKASIQNLPITVTSMKCDNLDQSRIEPIEPNTSVSYNQYLTTIKYQVDTAKSIRSILEEYVDQQNKNLHKQPSNI